MLDVDYNLMRWKKAQVIKLLIFGVMLGLLPIVLVVGGGSIGIAVIAGLISVLLFFIVKKKMKLFKDSKDYIKIISEEENSIKEISKRIGKSVDEVRKDINILIRERFFLNLKKISEEDKELIWLENKID